MDNRDSFKTGCILCPHKCGVNRDDGQRGKCGETSKVRIAMASLHMWEEPCISGEQGSGTVFFTGCSLKCVFCQNRAISGGQNGVEVTESELSDVFLKLQDMGAKNINLVTPTHFAPEIVKALEISKSHGLSLPIVYNTSSYETADTLKMLSGLVDIYLPDLKYKSTELSSKYSGAPDYFEVASRAVDEMIRQVGKADGSFPEMKRGVIVRHLLLPGFTDDSKEIISYLYGKYGNDIFISIMNQFTPIPELSNYPEINRKVTSDEYDDVIDYALSIGVTNAFIQEDGTAEESFIPDFYNFNLEKFLHG